MSIVVFESDGSTAAKAMISASSIYSSSYTAAKAFNGVSSSGSIDCWISSIGNGPDGSDRCWLKWNFGTSKQITGIQFNRRGDAGAENFPKDIKVYASATGVFAGEEVYIGAYQVNDAAFNTWSDWIDFSTSEYAPYLLVIINTMWTSGTSINWVAVQEIRFREEVASIAIDAVIPGFEASLEFGLESVAVLPVFESSIHITSFISLDATIPSFTGNVDFGGLVDGSLPSFNGYSAFGAAVSGELPSFVADAGFGTTLDADIPAFNAVIRSYDIIATAVMPSFVGYGYIRDSTNRITAELPKFTAGFEAGAIIDAQLPAFSVTGSIRTSSKFDMLATLPKFKVSAEIGGEQFFSMVATLPAFSAEFSGNAGYSFSFSGRLPRFRGSFAEAEDEVDQGISMVAEIPSFVCRFKDDSSPVLPSALRYIRNQVH